MTTKEYLKEHEIPVTRHEFKGQYDSLKACIIASMQGYVVTWYEGDLWFQGMRLHELFNDKK